MNLYKKAASLGGNAAQIKNKSPARRGSCKKNDVLLFHHEGDYDIANGAQDRQPPTDAHVAQAGGEAKD